jgi:hexosaminidase
MSLAEGPAALKVSFLHKLGLWSSTSSWQPVKERNETYGLTIEGTTLTIDAQSSWALSNAMATLYQLVQVKKSNEKSMLEISILGCPHTIVDTPAYPYRGVLVDTARSFYPVAWIRELIVHMSEFKLNVLHLHLTDTAAWPLDVDGHPELTEYLSYRDINKEKLSYSRKQVRELVEFGRLRGVSIVPEVDGPARASSWISKRFAINSCC